MVIDCCNSITVVRVRVGTSPAARAALVWGLAAGQGGQGVPNPQGQDVMPPSFCLECWRCRCFLENAIDAAVEAHRHRYHSDQKDYRDYRDYC